MLLRVLAGLVSVCLAIGHARAEPRIEWRLENPFRFFVNAADTEMHRASYAALGEQEKRSPVLSVERALSERHNGEGWASAILDATCWEPARNRHICRGRADYMNPKSHRIIADVKGVEEGSVGCTWLTAPIGGRHRGQSVTVPCDTPVILAIPYPTGAQVSVEVGGRQVAGEDVIIQDILVVGMGDSFGSGEGNPDVPVRFSRERWVDYGLAEQTADYAGYPARVGGWNSVGDKAFVDANPRWLDQACHRSLYSHQLRTALQLAVEQPTRAVTFVSYSCSGAEIVDGLFLRYLQHLPD